MEKVLITRLVITMVLTFIQTTNPNQSLTLTVKSFDPSTGKIEFTFEAASTADYDGNIYDGKPMTLSNGSFKGTVSPYYD